MRINERFNAYLKEKGISPGEFAAKAGLAEAYELLTQSKETEVVVLEESNCFGGISKTVAYKDNRMDMGGHRFFSKVPEINTWWEHMLPMQGTPFYDDILLNR